jgi:hypothetical protein
METNMELQTIAQRTQLPIRKLRYVLDHHMLPWLQVKIDERSVGQPRYFTDFEAFAVACAATLLVTGLKRETAVHFMERLLKVQWDVPRQARRPLNQGGTISEIDRLCLLWAYTHNKPAVAMLGDGSHIRVKSDTRDTGWRLNWPRSENPDKYEPMGFVNLNLGRLRDQLKA